MELLSRYLEEIPLGIVDNPHAEHPVVLSEFVTVCPSCRSINSLRHASLNVHCVECGWLPSVRESVRAA